MGMSMTGDPGEPIIEMNTTPLIDVMLVLLIMFIITIPVQTHAVKIDLPQGIVPPSEVRADKNKIVIYPADRVFWNGAPIDLVTLTGYLEASKTIAPAPELHIQPDPGARYERVDEVLAVTKRVGIEKMGFVGNERYRRF